MKPSIGRTVHFVLDRGPNKGQHRPAVIVRVWSDTCVQLQVFTDSDATDRYNDQIPNPLWATSVTYDETAEKIYSWHWPERVD